MAGAGFAAAGADLAGAGVAAAVFALGAFGAFAAVLAFAATLAAGAFGEGGVLALVDVAGFLVVDFTGAAIGSAPSSGGPDANGNGSATLAGVASRSSTTGIGLGGGLFSSGAGVGAAAVSAACGAWSGTDGAIASVAPLAGGRSILTGAATGTVSTAADAACFRVKTDRRRSISFVATSSEALPMRGMLCA